jgi:3-oxoacyl-[acyl-carrier-protein] synthase-3
MKRSIFSGSGATIPSEVVKNSDFLNHKFYLEDGSYVPADNSTVIDKFYKITGILERRYASPDVNSSDLATFAASEAIKDSGIDPEALDLIIVAHNFGDISHSTRQIDSVPSLASRVKYNLRIRNPVCIAFDVLFGCPGWLLAVMQADAFFKSGMAQTALVVGTETLSRVIDQHDRDAMIFGDGAGAVLMEYKETTGGILSSSALSHCAEETQYLNMGASYNSEHEPGTRFMKMKGRKVYEYALKHVPLAMKECFDKTGADISELKKIFIHQANEKMDEAILDGFFKLYGMKPPQDIMPMCIHYLGNSSVATVPTLFDLVRRGCQPGHQLTSGDLLLFASVGAGMNINALCYRYP